MNHDRPLDAVALDLQDNRKKIVYIGNLNFDTTEGNLYDAFSPFGVVTSVRAPVNDRGRRKGFAFVQF
jgi:RNA recognition motif-containing protein